jgi:hypothetical protein
LPGSWVYGKDPRQYGLDFGLWTRSTIAGLIELKFDLKLGLTAVGGLLAKLGLTPQKPLERVYQRDPEAIDRWKRESFPLKASAAKAVGGEVYFWNESGFRANTAHGKTWVKKGKTPAIARQCQRQSIGAVFAVNSKGAFWYTTYQRSLNAQLFATLLKPMMRNRNKPVHLEVDEMPDHKTKLVKEYVALTEGRSTIHVLPGCAPEPG